MKRIYDVVIAMVLLTATGCQFNNGPVYRPVDFVADSLVHNDVPKAADETREMLEDLEDEPVITVPDIPQESDILNDKSRKDVEKVMREGI